MWFIHTPQGEKTIKSTHRGVDNKTWFFLGNLSFLYDVEASSISLWGKRCRWHLWSCERQCEGRLLCPAQRAKKGGTSSSMKTEAVVPFWSWQHMFADHEYLQLKLHFSALLQGWPWRPSAAGKGACSDDRNLVYLLVTGIGLRFIKAPSLASVSSFAFLLRHGVYILLFRKYSGLQVTSIT